VITAQVENLTDTLEELKPHFPEHHRELGLFQDRMPLDPQYDKYLARDALGEVVLSTLRQDGAVVGYCVIFVAPGLHYQQTLTATVDIFWIKPELRGMGNATMLFDAAKAALVKRGVQLFWVGSKNHKPSEAFLHAFGFKPEETYFCMWLGD
jgi:GNAT superfamily N-acetyltransferase